MIGETMSACHLIISGAVSSPSRNCYIVYSGLARQEESFPAAVNRMTDELESRVKRFPTLKFELLNVEMRRAEKGETVHCGYSFPTTAHDYRAPRRVE
jgi:hypothetical protein